MVGLGQFSDHPNHPTNHPENPPIANFGNFGPILMKIGGEVLIRITKTKIKFGVPGAMFRLLQPPYPPTRKPPDS